MAELGRGADRVRTSSGAGCAAKDDAAAAADAEVSGLRLSDRAPAQRGSGGCVDRGWRFLQNDDLMSAEREFAAALKREPELRCRRTGAGLCCARPPETTGGPWTRFELPSRAPRPTRLRSSDKERRCSARPRGGGAQVARGGLCADRSLESLRARIDVLRFRDLQDLIAGAGGLATKAGPTRHRGVSACARRHARQCVPLSGAWPRANAPPGTWRCAQHFTRAVELDDTDATSLAQTGELLEERGDYAGAEAAYRERPRSIRWSFRGAAERWARERVTRGCPGVPGDLGHPRKSGEATWRR